MIVTIRVRELSRAEDRESWPHGDAVLKQPWQKGFAANVETSSNRAASHLERRIRDPVTVQASACPDAEGTATANQGMSYFMSKFPSCIFFWYRFLSMPRHTSNTHPSWSTLHVHCDHSINTAACTACSVLQSMSTSLWTESDRATQRHSDTTTQQHRSTTIQRHSDTQTLIFSAANHGDPL